MSHNNNLEDVFKNAFDGFEGEPSEGVWNSIAKDRTMKQNLGITEQTPESVFSKTFKSFSAAPSASVWMGVKAYLYKKILLRRFKYVLLILLFTGGIAALTQFNSPSKPVTVNLPLQARANNNSQTFTPAEANISENENLSEPSENAIVPLSDNRNNTAVPLSTVHTNAILTPARRDQVISRNISQHAEPPLLVNENKAGDKNPVDPPIFVGDPNEDAENKVTATDSLIANEEKAEALPTAIPEVKTQKASKKTAQILTEKKEDKRINNYVKYTRETDQNNEEARYKFGVMAGIDYANFYLKGGNDIYKDVRKNQEYFRPTSFHSGITFSAMLNEHWYIQTNAVFANQAMNVAYDYKIVKPDTTRDQQGNITKIENKVIFNVDTTTHYAFSTLEVPLMIGYRVGDKRWTFHVMSGPEWSLLLSKRGNMLSAATMQVAALDQNQIPTIKTLWGVWFAMGASYQISHQYSITLEHVFRYKFSSMFGPDYAAKQYNYSNGFNLGLRYHFD